MQLREYQQRAIDMLYAWFEKGNSGNPCLVLPTGSGKSHIIAALCKDALQSWPETRVLMLTHVKELIEQNSEKMRQHWPGAPMGIYSASIGSKNLSEPITFAGIQSIAKRAKEIGNIDLVLIDECHLVNHKDEGSYRSLLGELKIINPSIRVIGLTATPYRLGHGLITDKPALFDDLITPVSIEELVYKKHLCTLRSKITKSKLDTDGVHKRGGEFIESELQKAVDKDDKNQSIVKEVIALSGNRKSWLFFCSGVNHAIHIAQALNDHGVIAECVTGKTPKAERDRILSEFKMGRIKALTNANVLTTGFDHPGIDLIAMLRPTMSASLYVQMAGRGMRPKDHTDHCIVLDFAGVVETHGPITAVQPPKPGSSGDGEAPVKVCDECGELVHISAQECPACGHPFPPPVKKKLSLHNDDIMGVEGKDLIVSEWQWRKHVSRASGKEMLSCTFYGGLSDKPVTEYHCITHEGFAGQKARIALANIARSSGASLDYSVADIEDIANSMNNGNPPSIVEYKKDGSFFRVINRKWESEIETN
jgi:DNA repair protein RadD